MHLNTRSNRSDFTPDLFDSLQTLWDRFASGFIYAEEEDEPIVDCPYCNEDYNRGRGRHIFCDHCHPCRKRPSHGLSLQFA